MNSNNRAKLRGTHPSASVNKLANGERNKKEWKGSKHALTITKNRTRSLGDANTGKKSTTTAVSAPEEQNQEPVWPEIIRMVHLLTWEANAARAATGHYLPRRCRPTDGAQLNRCYCRIVYVLVCSIYFSIGFSILYWKNTFVQKLSVGAFIFAPNSPLSKKNDVWLSVFQCAVIGNGIF